MAPSGEDGVDFHIAATGPEIGWQDEPKVIELEPMLELLERLTAENGPDIESILEAEVLLREHGRLEET